MAEIIADFGAQTRSRSTFFVWMAGFCVFLAFGGFTPTYFGPIATNSLRDVAPVVHVHGLLFFSWTLMFLLQSSLVMRGNVSLHKSFGMGGIALATGMVIFGVIVNLLANEKRLAAGDLERGYELGLSGLFSMVSFATLFTLAIRNVRRPDYHRRWMLFATCMILNAAVTRLYLPLFDFERPPALLVGLTIDSILIACLMYDWRTLGRPHIVTLIAGAVLLGRQLFLSSISETALWRSTYDLLQQLVV